MSLYILYPNSTGSKDEMIVQRRQLENTFHILEAAQEVYEAFVKNVENEAGTLHKGIKRNCRPVQFCKHCQSLFCRTRSYWLKRHTGFFSDTVKDYVKTHSELQKVVESTESELVYRNMAEIFFRAGDSGS